MKQANLKLSTQWMAVLAFAALEARGEISRPVSAPEPRRIIVSIADRKLFVLEGDRVARAYDVAVGKTSTPTPRGTFAVINRTENPTWYSPKGPVAPGKDNPLGTRWMGLSAKGYGIHGTNVPSSIGKAASHGCIRMRQQDLEELYLLVTVGTIVELQAEPSTLVSKVLTQTLSE